MRSFQILGWGWMGWDQNHLFGLLSSYLVSWAAGLWIHFLKERKKKPTLFSVCASEIRSLFSPVTEMPFLCKVNRLWMTQVTSTAWVVGAAPPPKSQVKEMLFSVWCLGQQRVSTRLKLIHLLQAWWSGREHGEIILICKNCISEWNGYILYFGQPVGI